APDIDGMGLLHLFALPSHDSAIPDEPWRTFLAPESGLPFKETLLFDAAEGGFPCLAAVQEDAAGRWSEPSEVVCWSPDPCAPPEAALQPTLPEGCGCSAAAASPGALGWLVLPLLGLLRRRRG